LSLFFHVPPLLCLIVLLLSLFFHVPPLL
jgi:hypothetical protein